MFWEISPARAARLIYNVIERKKEIAYIPLRWRVVVIFLRIIPNFIFSRL